MGKDNDEAAGGFGSVFRDRLTYLMNGNNVYGKPVNTQELADELTSAAGRAQVPQAERPARGHGAVGTGREPHRAVFSARRRTSCSALTRRPTTPMRSAPARATSTAPSA